MRGVSTICKLVTVVAKTKQQPLYVHCSSLLSITNFKHYNCLSQPFYTEGILETIFRSQEIHAYKLLYLQYLFFFLINQDLSGNPQRYRLRNLALGLGLFSNSNISRPPQFFTGYLPTEDGNMSSFYYTSVLGSNPKCLSDRTRVCTLSLINTHNFNFP